MVFNDEIQQKAIDRKLLTLLANVAICHQRNLKTGAIKT